jgi:hypothetical protein
MELIAFSHTAQTLLDEDINNEASYNMTQIITVE